MHRLWTLLVSVLILSAPAIATHNSTGVGASDPPAPSEGPADPDTDEQPVYHRTTPWEFRVPPDQSGSAYGGQIGFFDVVPVTYVGMSTATVQGMERTWATDPIGSASGDGNHEWRPGVEAWGPNTGTMVTFYAYLFGDGTGEDDTGAPLVAGEGPFNGLPDDLCQGTQRCQLLTPADVTAVADGGLPSVCVYVPFVHLMRVDDGLCRDVELRYSNGAGKGSTWVEQRLPGWYGTTWFEPSERALVDAYGVVAPQPSDAPCIQPGFTGGVAFDHDHVHVEPVAQLGLEGPVAAGFEPVAEAASDGHYRAAHLADDPIPEGVVQVASPQPNHPDDTSGALSTVGDTAVSCTADGPALVDDEPWTNHARLHVNVYFGLGWWPPRSIGQHSGASPEGAQPWSGAVHYLANTYVDDLAEVRDTDGDGEVDGCTEALGSSTDCVPMLWDTEGCFSPSFCARDLASSFDVGDDTGLAMVLRTQGPIVVWDSSDGALEHEWSWLSTGEVCIVGWSGGVDATNLPGGRNLVEESCAGIPDSRRLAMDNAFLPQEQLGEYRGALRWTPLGPERDVLGQETGRLELHYILTVPEDGLKAGFPDHLALGSGDHCGNPAVIHCGPRSTTYDWVDVEPIRM